MDKEYMNKGCYMEKRDQSTCQPNSDVGDKEVWREIHQQAMVVQGLNDAVKGLEERLHCILTSNGAQAGHCPQERHAVESDLGQHIRHQTTQVEENLDIIRHLLEHLAI